MGSVHKQWTVVPEAQGQHPSSVASQPREHIAGGQVSVQPAALANRQFIVLLVLQHYLLSDYCPKLASMVSAWCLQVGADKAYNILCTSTTTGMRVSITQPTGCLRCVSMPLQAHTAGVCATRCGVDSLCRRSGVQMSAQEPDILHARTLQSHAGCSLL
jgi:hypothetical protein